MITAARRRFRPLSIAWLTVMWVTLWGQISWGNVIAGVLVGLAITLLLPLPTLPTQGIRIHWLSLCGLLARYAGELVTSSLHVAWIALRRKEQPPSAIVQVPMNVPEDLVFSFAVTLLNLLPGGMVTDLDIHNRMLTVHLLDGSSTAAIDREIARIGSLEDSLNRIFERG